MVIKMKRCSMLPRVLRANRAVSCAAILAISDELYEPWRIGFQTEEFHRAMVRCGLAALEAAKG